MSDVFTKLLEEDQKQIQEPKKNSTRQLTSKITHARNNPRELSRELPTGDEIEEYSFQLRKSYKVKIQAEVPPEWQEELQEIARERKVGKLELYRFIFGEFLGKVKRKK